MVHWKHELASEIRRDPGALATLGVLELEVLEVT